LFEQFSLALQKKRYYTQRGTIIDATFIEAPHCKNTHEQREKVKDGKVPEEWSDPTHPQKLMQRDLDAQWAVKNKEVHFGFKDNVAVDKDSKLITTYTVTSVNVSDIKGAEKLVSVNDTEIYADAAYPSLVLLTGVINKIGERAYLNTPLYEARKRREQISTYRF
jgi:hypothetical protein